MTMPKIIVVDDDQVFCGLLKTVLEFDGYEVVVESNPEAVLGKVRELAPAMVLMDVHSERGDTLGVLRALQADEIAQRVPVVMTSGMDRSLECEQAGAAAFLLKPFRPDELSRLAAKLAPQ